MTTQTAARARATDPATSHAAAASVSRTAEVRDGVLAIVRVNGPMTDEEIARSYATHVDLFGWLFPAASPSGLRTRRAELVTAGQVVDTGRRAETASGRTAIVWAVA